jgi:Matrixin
VTNNGPAARARRRTVALLLVGLVAACLSGCAQLAAAADPPGMRRGVDVPSRPAHPRELPIGTPAIPPAGAGGYAFLLAHADGSPVTWDPCRPVHFVVRPDGAPGGGDALVRWALGQISHATGLSFVDDGVTNEAPSSERASFQPARYGDRWAPVLIAWSNPVEWPPLAGGILGRAGPAPFGLMGKDDERFVSGQAVFNGPEVDLQLRTGDDNKARAVLLHELGHLVGLAHVTDPYQVMFPTNDYPLPSYRSGDLRGLALLGAGRCFTDY